MCNVVLEWIGLDTRMTRLPSNLTIEVGSRPLKHMRTGWAWVNKCEQENSTLMDLCECWARLVKGGALFMELKAGGRVEWNCAYGGAQHLHSIHTAWNTQHWLWPFLCVAPIMPHHAPSILLRSISFGFIQLNHTEATSLSKGQSRYYLCGRVLSLAWVRRTICQSKSGSGQRTRRPAWFPTKRRNINRCSMVRRYVKNNMNMHEWYPPSISYSGKGSKMRLLFRYPWNSTRATFCATSMWLLLFAHCPAATLFCQQWHVAEGWSCCVPSSGDMPANIIQVCLCTKPPHILRHPVCKMHTFQMFFQMGTSWGYRL
jgi:hypothetical protein